MTRLPRSAHRVRGVLAAKLRLPPWHTLCICLGASGCFYFGPIPYEPEDEPPRVYSDSFPDDGDTVIDLTYDAQHTEATLFVAALDPEGLAVHFAWSWGDGTAINDAVDSVDRSVVSLELYQELDGEVIECVVSDPGANTVTLSAEIGINRSATVAEEGA